MLKKLMTTQNIFLIKGRNQEWVAGAFISFSALEKSNKIEAEEQENTDTLRCHFVHY